MVERIMDMTLIIITENQYLWFFIVFIQKHQKTEIWNLENSGILFTEIPDF